VDTRVEFEFYKRRVLTRKLLQGPGSFPHVTCCPGGSGGAIVRVVSPRNMFVQPGLLLCKGGRVAVV
jgi:hypothetical protein